MMTDKELLAFLREKEAEYRLKRAAVRKKVGLAGGGVLLAAALSAAVLWGGLFRSRQTDPTRQAQISAPDNSSEPVKIVEGTNQQIPNETVSGKTEIITVPEESKYSDESEPAATTPEESDPHSESEPAKSSVKVIYAKGDITNTAETIEPAPRGVQGILGQLLAEHQGEECLFLVKITPVLEENELREMYETLDRMFKERFEATAEARSELEKLYYQMLEGSSEEQKLAVWYNVQRNLLLDECYEPGERIRLEYYRPAVTEIETFLENQGASSAIDKKLNPTSLTIRAELSEAMIHRLEEEYACVITALPESERLDDGKVIRDEFIEELERMPETSVADIVFWIQPTDQDGLLPEERFE